MNRQRNTPLESISLDAAFSLVREPRRRLLIRVLADHGRTLTVNDLTKEIVDQETDEEVTDVSGEKMTQVATSLYHKHIPHLADAGVIEHNADRQLVEPTETLESVVSFLDVIQEE